MTKEEKANKEVEVATWMTKQGYDRRAAKNVAPVIVHYLSDNAVSSDVSGSYSDDELEEMRRLAHEGLPDDCVKGWNEVKFCEIRNGDGGECKWCSNYR